MALWVFYVEWEDDSHDGDVAADTIEDAARIVWDEWHPTAWQSAAVYGPDYALSIDLDADEFSAKRF